MVFENGTKVKITQIQKKDFDWFDNEFEKLSALVNGKEGVITSHLPALPEYDEREAYMIKIDLGYITKNLELEQDEFDILK